MPRKRKIEELPTPVETQTEAAKKMNRLQAVKASIRQKASELNPVYYGLPDLLFGKDMAPGKIDPSTGEVTREGIGRVETETEYLDRQDEAVEMCVRVHLKVMKDGVLTEPELIPEMIELIADLFYCRVNMAVLWANRGGGKSLVAAIIIWLCLVYRRKSCVNMGGTGEQAKRVYEYTVQFWDCVPGLKDGMLEEDPLLKLTSMKGKTKLICCSGEQGVGEHLPMFVADEACTDKPGAENNIRRAMQGAFDNDDFLVLMLSTFHHPVGLFQETWDNAAQLGYKTYRWTIYDTMQRCDVGMEEATPEDPYAQKFCTTKCPLTRLEDVRDDFGKISGQAWAGCCGRARTSHGWQSRNLVLAKFESNKGTRLYQVEHECQRPRHEGQIYIPTVIDSCVFDQFQLNTKARKVIGIDWGLTQCAMVLLGEWIDGKVNGVGVIATRIMSNRLTDEVISQILYWQSLFGDEVVIRADHSHPYCNKELRQKRYRVRTVKGDKDKLGEDNAQRWLSSGRFRILRELGLLITQCKNLRRGEDGKQLKENRDDERGDHLPDAMKFGLMEYDYQRWLIKFGGALAAPADYEAVANEED